MPNIRRTMMGAAGVASGPTGEAGALWMWGRGDLGSIGNSQAIKVSSPVQVGSLTDWKAVGMWAYTVLAVKSDGTLWSWGNNNEGCCGLNIAGKVSSPTQVGSLTNWSKPGQGRVDPTLAIKTDGTLWCVGGGFGSGRQGLSGVSTTSLSSPVQIGSLTTWKKVVNGQAVYALKTDGTIWVWGDGADGILGLGQSPSVDVSSPTQLGSLTTWTDVAASNRAGAAVKSDGTLWVWGHAGYGELGNDQVAADASSPIQLGSLTTWKAVFGTSQGFRAIKTDGTMWSWGRGNFAGNHGDNNAISRSSPVLVGGGTDWDYNYTAGVGGFNGNHLQTDGSLWVWGYNNNGQLGLGTVVNYSSPVQLGTLKTWQSAGCDDAVSWGIIS